MNFKESEVNVLQWAKNRKILHAGNTYQQYAKFMEEANEILIALNKKEIVIKQAGKLDITSEKERAIFRHIRTENENELKDAFGDTIVTLIILAGQNGLKLEDCLEYAYNEIKDRTGKTVNGTFVKD
jgi:NTP pyrophosphatase (non-canonical NTP hydrolase)